MTLGHDAIRQLEALPNPLPVASVRAARSRGLDVAVCPPGSKSLTNRAVLLAALASGVSRLRRPLADADDAERMLAAVRELGAVVERSHDGVTIEGVGGRWRVPASGVTLNLNNAGTATRFLAAAALLAPGPVTIDGNARMRQRPIGELVWALEELGAKVEFVPVAGGLPGCPPVRVVAPNASTLHVEHALEIPTTQSSQFISALLMIGPWLPDGITIRLVGHATSASYIRMTLGLLAQVGAVVRHTEDMRVLRVSPPADGSPLRGFDYLVEPDASGATYFWGAAALCPGSRCLIRDLPTPSLQGDADFVQLLDAMGCGVTTSPEGVAVVGAERLQAIDADMSDMPDATMTLAAVAAFAPEASRLTGIRTLRVKETDRVEALRIELAKIGVHVESPVDGDADAMVITPPAGGVDCSANVPPVVFDTYDDHRMAMSLALIGLRRPNVLIRHPACVAKTYPTFWQEWERLFA